MFTQRDFTRTGRRGVLGVLEDGSNAVMRYYITTFRDSDRQTALDILMCLTSPSPSQSLETHVSTSELAYACAVLYLYLYLYQSICIDIRIGHLLDAHR